MIRQSNRSGSTTSEFQKSMLNKLDSLCSPSPTFESVDSETSLSFHMSNTSANMRRRRLYHSPGALGALQSPANALAAAAALASREEKVQSFGNILAERARLVQKTLTRNALASQQSSTPVRPKSASTTEHFGAGSVAVGSRNASTPARSSTRTQKTTATEKAEKSDNMILGSLSAFESTEVHSGLLSVAEESGNVTRSVCSRGTQSTAYSSNRSRSRSCSNNVHMSHDSSVSMSADSRLTKSEVAAIDSLKLTAFPLKRRRKDRNLQWFALVCSSIKRLVNYVPSQSENVSRCTCLQLALVATKQATVSDNNWLSEFVEQIALLVQTAGRCPLHKRSVRSLLKEKRINVKEGQSLLDEDNMSCIVKWLQDSRSLLMQRLASNIQLLL